MSRTQLFSAALGALLGAALTAATLAHAQAPSVTVTPRQTAAASGVAASTAAPGAALQRVNDETFVSVKDHGASQTVIVYKLDDKGQARLTHKAKFFY